VSAPFAEFTWRHARKLTADRGLDDTNESEVARQPYPGATAPPAASTEAPQPGRASPGKARSRRVGASGAGAESAA
jgi:hypothetical protein